MQNSKIFSSTEYELTIKKQNQTHKETNHNEDDLAQTTDLDSQGLQILEISDTGHKITLYRLFKETKHGIKMG